LPAKSRIGQPAQEQKSETSVDWRAFLIL
jgi:hypothetical protein